MASNLGFSNLIAYGAVLGEFANAVMTCCERKQVVSRVDVG